MPGWLIRVYISGWGHAYHESPFCRLLMMGQGKSAARGHGVRKVRVIALQEAEKLGRRGLPRVHTAIESGIGSKG